MEAADAVGRWIAGRDFVAFAADEQLQAAVTYQIQIIGEAASKLSPEFRAAIPSVPWDSVIGMRHIIVHDYYRIDVDIVWQVATERLASLATALRERFPDL